MSCEGKKVIDIRLVGEETKFTDVVSFTNDIAVDSVVRVMDGLLETGKDALQTSRFLFHGDTEEASEILKKRLRNITDALNQTAKDGLELVDAGWESLVSDKDFINDENKARLTRVTTTALYGLLGASFIDDGE